MTTIYQDGDRRVEMDQYQRLRASNTRGQPLYVDAADPTTRLSDTLPPGTAKAIRQRGDDPHGWYTVIAHSHPKMVLPPASRPAVALAIATAQAERRQILNDPANRARRVVSALYAQAHGLQDDPGRYFPALNAAEAALKAWREEYPEAARRERRGELLAQAQEWEDKAKGALTYDADGSLNAEAQQARHDELMAKAVHLREQAAGGESNERTSQ